MALHEEVGPRDDRSPRSPRRAGVTRPTVYAQFPDDLTLFQRLQRHMARSILDRRLEGLELEEALRSALQLVVRGQRADAEQRRARRRLLPTLRQVRPRLGGARRGRRRTGGSRPETVAAVRLAFDFFTWSRWTAALAPAATPPPSPRLVTCT